MARRIHVPKLSAGLIELDPAQAHHLRDVLRLKLGAAVELFDDAGHVAEAIVTRCDNQVTLRAEQVRTDAPRGQIVVASAVPKGDRADWMMEKLSELGVARFIPLKTARSVVHPTGASKRDRWQRIATESAKQSHRAGVMQIDKLMPIEEVIKGQRAEGKGQNSQQRIYLSTEDDAQSLSSLFSALIPHPSAFLMIGPEGGWTDEEIAAFGAAGLVAAKLTRTVLRIETAAIVAAAVVMAMRHD